MASATGAGIELAGCLQDMPTMPAIAWNENVQASSTANKGLSRRIFIVCYQRLVAGKWGKFTVCLNNEGLSLEPAPGL